MSRSAAKVDSNKRYDQSSEQPPWLIITRMDGIKQQRSLARKSKHVATASSPDTGRDQIVSAVGKLTLISISNLLSILHFDVSKAPIAAVTMMFLTESAVHGQLLLRRLSWSEPGTGQQPSGIA